MRVVQMPVHEIVDMAVMRHRLVSAAGTMDVARFMTWTAGIRRAGDWVRLRHRPDIHHRRRPCHHLRTKGLRAVKELARSCDWTRSFDFAQDEVSSPSRRLLDFNSFESAAVIDHRHGRRAFASLEDAENP